MLPLSAENIADFFPGNEAYDAMRPRAYEGADVVLICFSVVSEDSMKEITSKFHAEVEANCPGVPVLLVGLQAGGDRDERCVYESEGNYYSKQISAYTYVECSIGNMDSINEVFTQASIVLPLLFIRSLNVMHNRRSLQPPSIFSRRIQMCTCIMSRYLVYFRMFVLLNSRTCRMRPLSNQ